MEQSLEQTNWATLGSEPNPRVHEELITLDSGYVERVLSFEPQTGARKVLRKYTSLSWRVTGAKSLGTSSAGLQIVIVTDEAGNRVASSKSENLLPPALLHMLKATPDRVVKFMSPEPFRDADNAPLGLEGGLALLGARLSADNIVPGSYHGTVDATRGVGGATAKFHVVLRLKTLNDWEIDFVPDESANVRLTATLRWCGPSGTRFEETKATTMNVRGLSASLSSVRGALNLVVKERFVTTLQRRGVGQPSGWERR